MANIKSAKKRIKVAARDQKKNHWYKLRVKNLIKDALLAIKGKKEDALAKIRSAISMIDKAASKNIISRNRASRKKSQLMKLVKA